MTEDQMPVRQPRDWAAIIVATHLQSLNSGMSLATLSHADRNDFITAVIHMAAYLDRAQRDAKLPDQIPESSVLPVVNQVIREVSGSTQRLAEECGCQNNQTLYDLLVHYVGLLTKLRSWVSAWKSSAFPLNSDERHQLITFLEQIANLESFFRDPDEPETVH
jgi:hypothetical protein